MSSTASSTGRGSKSAAARMAYRERVTWVKAHPGLTILIALATFVLLGMIQSVLFNVGGSIPGSGEGDIIQTVESAILSG